MQAYDLVFPRIKQTQTGTGSQTFTLDKDYQGLVIDNQNSTQITYVINTSSRVCPANSIRGLLLDSSFNSIVVTASGYYEIHLF